MFGAITHKSTDMWNPVVGNKYITTDLDTSYLHVRTNSTVGSGDYTWIWYYDEEGRAAGGIVVWFSSTVKYRLRYCQQSYTSFPTSIPAEQDKEWVIEKRDLKTKVYCNGQQVLDITVSSETCDPKYADTWETYWGREVSKIRFSSQYDTASDYYYIG